MNDRSARLGGRYVVRITPEDVGERVSVRSRIQADDAGPQFTDTLGILESWQSGTLRIRRRDGSLAEVAEPAMVAGRILPPPVERRPRTA